MVSGTTDAGSTPAESATTFKGSEGFPAVIALVCRYFRNFSKEEMIS